MIFIKYNWDPLNNTESYWVPFSEVWKKIYWYFNNDIRTQNRPQSCYIMECLLMLYGCSIWLYMFNVLVSPLCNASAQPWWKLYLEYHLYLVSCLTMCWVPIYHTLFYLLQIVSWYMFLLNKLLHSLLISSLLGLQMCLDWEMTKLLIY